MFLRYLFSKINQYFSKVFLGWILTVTLIFLFVISLAEFAEYSRRIIQASHISFGQIANLIILKLPKHTKTILPFVVFVASIITFVRLNRTGEITIVRNLGIALRQIIAGFSTVIITIFIVLLLIIDPISSILTQKQKELENRIFSSATVATISVFDNGIWLRENMNDRQSIINLKTINIHQKDFDNVTFQNFSDGGGVKERLVAKKASIRDGQWLLREVTVITLGKEVKTEEIYELRTYLTFQKILDSNLPPDFISFWQLPDYIELLKKSGLSTTRYSLYWHNMWGTLGVLFAMVYLAGSFSLRPIRRGGTTLLIMLAVFSGLIFYFMSNLVLALGLAEKMPIFIAVWCPTIIILLLSHTLILHLEEG